MPVTLKDIAKRAGVSSQVVSTVLTGRGNSGASAANREKIARIAKEMGYQPNVAARQLRGRPAQAIGILVPPFSYTLPSDLMMMISEKLLQKGYHPYLTIVSDRKRRDDVIQELIARGVDGIIQGYAHGSNEPVAQTAVPMVSYSCGEASDIASDLRLGGYLATEHLLEHGHRKVGLLASRFTSVSDLRPIGWEEALRARGVVPDPSWRVELSMNGQFREQLDHLIKREQVSALFCYNDYNAGKLVHYLRNHGYRIPEDIAIVGYDGAGFAEFTDPPLTTVIQPMEATAHAIVELLVRKVENKICEQLPQPAITPRLHLGRSCGCQTEEPDLVYWGNSYNSLEMAQKYATPHPSQFDSIDHRFDKGEVQ